MKMCSIKRDKKKGRGVYAEELINRGDTIEICELVLIPMNEVGDDLSAYVFGYNNKQVAMALGNGSLYNHDKKPNANCYFSSGKKQLVFEAIKNIRPNEEILINYCYSKADQKRYQIS
ncbi:MAG: SET domain-containing protein-lysine N-methyltransferase [Bdellovibrionales bacterium]|nr:SET domain-containing protein-lysine N-methyltransferase [Bdellovibrionales bacterium]